MAEDQTNDPGNGNTGRQGPLMDGQNALIDTFIIADRVETVNGKFYMMGGGITDIWATSFPTVLAFGLALGILVPWNATNHQIQVAVVLQTQDGDELGRIGLPLTVGRPPNLAPGDVQFIPFSIPQLNLGVQQAGTLIAIALLDGVEQKRRQLRVRPVGQ